jgi:hypothetical protein
VQISHLVVVRGFDTTAKDMDPSEPFQFHGGRVTPTLGGTVYAVTGATLALFFVVYPDTSIAASPDGFVEYIRDGTLVAKSAISLPAADALGRIPYVVSSPAESMRPGAYEVRAVIRQGDTAVEEHAFVNVQPVPRP